MFQVIKLLCLKPSSTNKSDIGLSTVQLVDKMDS